MGAMNDFERRRIQNREAQRRFRQRHNQRKNANQAVQTVIVSEVTTDQPSRRESPEKPNSPSALADKLIDPFLTAATPTNSPFSTAFDHGVGNNDTGIYSPTLLDGIDFTNLNNARRDIHDQGLTFPASPSSLLQVSPGDTSSDSNTDHILDVLIASTHNRDGSSTTFCEGAQDHIGGSGNGKGGPAGNCVSLAAAAGNGAAPTNPGPGEKPDSGWQNPLHIAAAKGHDRIARILLQHNVVDCNEKDSDGLTPLIHATIGGYEDVVRSLLSHGATIDMVDCQHRRSALHWAIVHRRESVLKILLDWCVTQQTAIDMYDEAGRTPLHTAVDSGYDAGVQLLLQLGANARYRTKKRKLTGWLEANRKGGAGPIPDRDNLT